MCVDVLPRLTISSVCQMCADVCVPPSSHVRLLLCQLLAQLSPRGSAFWGESVQYTRVCVSVYVCYRLPSPWKDSPSVDLTGVQPGSSPHANCLNWRTTNAARQDETVLSILFLFLYDRFSFSFYFYFFCSVLVLHLSHAVTVMMCINLITQKRESVWNLHFLIKPEITMATGGKSRFLCWVDKKTTSFQTPEAVDGGVFFEIGVARCIYTGLKVDLIRCDCNVRLLWVILSVLSSRNGQTVNTNIDLNEEPLMFDVVGSFNTVSIGRLSFVVMVMSALVGGLTVPHPCLWMYSEGAGLVQTWHGAVLAFLEERFSDWICMLSTFCSNGREGKSTKRCGSSSMLSWIKASMIDSGEESSSWRRGLQLCSVSSDASQGSTEGTSRCSWTYGVQNTVFYIVIINKHLQNLLSIFLLFTFFFCFWKKKNQCIQFFSFPMRQNSGELVVNVKQSYFLLFCFVFLCSSFWAVTEGVEHET